MLLSRFRLLVVAALLVCLPVQAQQAIRIPDHRPPKPGPQARIDWSDPINRGLVSMFLFNDGGGTPKESVAAGRVSTVTPTGTMNWTRLAHGPALDLDGSTYLTIDDRAALTLTEGMTISVWLVFDGATSNTIIGKYSTTHEFLLGTFGTDGHVYFFGYSQSTNGLSGRHGTQPAAGTLANLVAVWEGGSVLPSTFKIYSNGTRIDSADFTSGTFVGIEDTASPLTIGYSPDWESGAKLNGTISQVRILNRGLSAGEVQRLYLEGEWSGLIAPEMWVMSTAPPAAVGGGTGGGIFGENGVFGGRVVSYWELPCLGCPDGRK